MPRNATNATPQRAGARARKGRRDWAKDFLQGFAETGTVTGACDQAGIERSTAYRARQRDESFAVAWSDAEDELTDRLASKAVEMALGGDSYVLMFLLKSRRPEVYSERHRLEHTGSGGGPVAVEALDINLDALSERDLKTLQGILTKAEHADRR